MATEVFMPKAGMDMQEGTIIKWLSAIGNEVHEGDPLLEIETDKVTMEVEAPCDGTLLCKYFEDGAVVPVVTIIGYIGEKGENVPDKPAMAGGKARADEEAVLKGASAEENDSDFTYKVAVIGGGPAGYIAALRAARMGARTILFEEDEVGGTCTNVGCIPMKTYIKTAQDIDAIRNAGRRGVKVDVNTLKIDMPEIYKYKKRVVERLRKGILSLLKAGKVDLVCEEAIMIGPHTIRAGKKTYRSENIILCGGSVSSNLPVEGIDQPEIIASEGMLDLTEVPERLLIIGGGVIGCEMATAFSRFGSKVTIVELQDHLIPTFDHEVSEAMEKIFRGHGIKVQTGKKVVRFLRRDEHPVLVLNDGTEIDADIVLMSVGRKPNLTCLGVLKDKIDCERGKIMVDEYCRTNLDHIYACGDMTNRSILAHSAMKMGDSAASTACGKPKEVNLNRAPLCLYTIPEAASIGLTESQARKRGEIMIGKFPFAANGRAISAGQPEGFVKVIADKGYGEILGVHIVGPMATEIIVEAKTMMDMEVTVYEVADIMHPHPTCSEAFMAACADAIDDCLDLPARSKNE